MKFTEGVVEEAALQYFSTLGYEHLHGSTIGPDGVVPERSTYDDVVLVGRLQRALQRINPDVPTEGIADAIRKVLRPEGPTLVTRNRSFHRMLTDGVDVEYRAEGRVKGDKVWFLDFEAPENNDWLAVNQFTVVEGQHTRRPDIVVFVNGLPLAVIELKNPGDEHATTRAAFNQLQTYKLQVPSLFAWNELLMASDGTSARVGSLTAPWEWFGPWRTIDGSGIEPPTVPQLEVAVKGVFEKSRFLDLVRHFLVFEDDGAEVLKKLAGYHQFHAVNKAVDCTIQAAGPEGDRRVGVVWHTQGSGKSLSMVFYAGKAIRHPALENPTLVLLTDRNDLDEQLLGNFSLARDLVPFPEQAESRAHLRELLERASGGVIFTTIQKFAPDKGERFELLSERRNIVVIADEAHRSQYDFIDGFARHLRDGLPNASFIGFTGTPIEAADKSTPAVFGDYIDVYDITQAVEDGATVPIFYEGRLAKIELDPDERPRIDPEFEEVTESEEETTKQRLKGKWGRLEAMVGTDKRLALVARDLIDHFERRSEAIEGKAMVVAMSRRICVDLYDAIVALRPAWHGDDDDEGVIKVVMTGSASDPLPWQAHIRNKGRNEAIKRRLRDPADGLELVIVRDMWLTGFDAPPLHTMYVDKPMRSHNLMQAIARVNRVFRDKPGGLVVDYLGIAEELKRALSDYTERDRGNTGIDQAEAVAVMKEKHDVVTAILHGLDWSLFTSGDPTERLALVAAGMEHVLAQEEGKERFLTAVGELTRAYALAVPHDDALAIRDDMSYFQTLRGNLAKHTITDGRATDDLDLAVRQIVSKAVSSDEVVDIFAAAGLGRPDISILSDEFLAEVEQMPQRNLALEALRKLLSEEIKVRSARNVVQARTFSEMLERAIRQYQNRSLEAAEVIAELVRLAKEMRAAQSRGAELGLRDDELAFYDALATNESAVAELGDETLKAIARELVETIRGSATIDWQVKENVRAAMRARVKRLLRKYDYPPDKTEAATLTVIEQAEVLTNAWVVAPPEPPTTAEVVPFRRIAGDPAAPYETSVPLYTLAAAAGTFGETQSVEPDGWVEPTTTRRLREGMFVARVVGRSMEPDIPDGAHGLFSLYRGGTRHGKIVLAQHRDIADPETGGSYTVKLYQRDPPAGGAGSRVRLLPRNHEFAPIELTEAADDEVTVIAELVEVLPGSIAEDG